MKNRPSRFTLPELLLVIAISGLLIALLLPALNQSRARSRTALCVSQLNQLLRGVLLYAGDFRLFPRWVNMDNYAGILTGSGYLDRKIMICPEYPAAGRTEFNRFQCYGLFEVTPSDPVTSQLFAGVGRFELRCWDGSAEQLCYDLERLRHPERIMFFRDSGFPKSGRDWLPTASFSRQATDAGGVRLHHQERSAGGAADGHVELNSRAGLLKDPLLFKSVFSSSGTVFVLR